MDNIAHLSRRYYNIQALSKLFLKILKDTINLIFYYYLNFFWRKKKERTNLNPHLKMLCAKLV